MRLHLFYFLMGFLCLNTGFAQDAKKNKGPFSEVSYQYIKPFHTSTSGNYYSGSRTDFDQGHYNGVQGMLGYYINPHFSVGAGLSFAKYYEVDFGRLPVFVDLRGYLKGVKKTPYVYLDGGYIIECGDSFEKGFILETGVGYRLPIIKSLGLVASLGYQYAHSPTETLSVYGMDDRWISSSRHSLTLSVGVSF